MFIVIIIVADTNDIAVRVNPGLGHFSIGIRRSHMMRDGENRCEMLDDEMLDDECWMPVQSSDDPETWNRADNFDYMCC